MTILLGLLEANIAAAAAIAVVLLLRRQAHRHLGPRAAYLMWAIVPAAVLATFLPARAVEVMAVIQLPGAGADAAAAGAGASRGLEALPAVLLLAWVGGGLAMAYVLARRQDLFAADLASGMAGPAVIGFFRPRIVTPDDFVDRFDHTERRLILAHEQVHLERQDARINAAVAALRCVCWFNPMVHIGANAMRMDQEMSCDAAVIEHRPKARRAYAETLLKTQLAAHPLPVGCYWPPGGEHPLAERIAMLARTPLSQRRRLAASGAVALLAAGGGLAAWAAQPERTVAADTIEAAAPAEEEMLVAIRPLGADGRLTNDNPAPAPQTRAYRATEAGVTRPSIGPGFVQPEYPAEAIAQHLEGETTVSACVAAGGQARVQDLVKSSGHRLLDEATVKAVESSQFRPGMRAGVPVDTCGYALTWVWKIPPEGPEAPAQ